MTQVFPKYADSILWGVLFLVAAGAAAFFPIRSRIEDSSYATRVGLYQSQPSPFSHQHHVGGVGIHCRYCHSTVEKSAFAGIPSTETCMGCHSHIWKEADVLAPVRASWESQTPLIWNKVYSIPDYVYFDHSIHVAKGVGCESCHGRVDTMPLITKVKAFHMKDCLDCHRRPEQYLRPRERIYDMNWKPDEDSEKLGRKLVDEYGIRKAMIADCTACHR